MFSCEYCKVFKNIYFERYLEAAASENLSSAVIVIFRRYFVSSSLSLFSKIVALKASAKFLGKHIYWNIYIVHKLLNYKSHCKFSSLNFPKSGIFFNPIFIPCFSRSRVRDQVLEVALKLIVYIRHDIYVYNFSSLSINVRNICTKPDRRLKVFIYVMIFVSKEVFLIHNNLVTQKIFYCEIIHQSRKQCLFFIYEGECVLIFLNIRSNFLVQTSFLSMLVEIDVILS